MYVRSELNKRVCRIGENLNWINIDFKFLRRGALEYCMYMCIYKFKYEITLRSWRMEGPGAAVGNGVPVSTHLRSADIRMASDVKQLLGALPTL